jgi:hypothetical protein
MTSEAISSKELKRLRRIEAAAQGIREMDRKQREYTRHLQDLAAEARRTGQSQTHRIQPRVHDFGNVVADLIDALGGPLPLTPRPSDTKESTK